MYLARQIIFLTSLTVLGGCASTIDLPFQKLNYDSLYLRGVFTWWEADENYKVERVNDELYKASVKLIADGQPYDFKFADESWSPGLACGPMIERDSVLSTEERLEANCNNPKANFKFTPSETGIFDFYIDFSDPTEPEVYIKRTF